MNLNIALDMSSLPYNRGVSRYTTNLARALCGLQTSTNIQIHGFGYSLRQREVLKQQMSSISFTSQKILPVPPSIVERLWNHTALFSPELLFPNLRVFHSWEYQPTLKRAALVSTIHDLAMLRFPETAHPNLLKIHKASWKKLRTQAQAIIAVSESTKQDIVELLEIPAEKVIVIPEALPAESILELTKDQIALQLRTIEYKKPYILFVGTTEPRKNLSRLLSAWRKHRREFDLVIAGAQGWDEIRAESGLHILGEVSAPLLAALYSRASMLAYPSLYEGFGFPILEAFHYDVPVVTSIVSSMAEIAGDAAILINPLEIDSISQGIELAAQQSKELVKKGKQRLQHYSWEKVARQTLDVYRKVAW